MVRLLIVGLSFLGDSEPAGSPNPATPALIQPAPDSSVDRGEAGTSFAMPPLSWPPLAKRRPGFRLVWPPSVAPGSSPHAATPPGLFHEPEADVVCTLRTVPADPNIDRGMVRPVESDVDPEMVLPSSCRAGN